MGGCVSSYMESQSEKSLIPHPLITSCRAYDILSGPVGEAASSHETPVYRYRQFSDEEHAKVVHDTYYDPNWVLILREKAEKIPHQPALAYRDVERIENRETTVDGKKKTVQYYHCSSRKSITFQEMWNRMETFGRGLRALGIPSRSFVCMYEETRWEWLVSVYGIWTQDYVASTVYANLGPDALSYALTESSAAAIICNGKQVPQLLALLTESKLNPIVIYLDDVPTGVPLSGAFQLLPWSEVFQLGEKNKDIPLHIPSDNDEEALVMYTSGTTGDPKGVIHSHGSLASGFRVLRQRVEDLYPTTTTKEFYCAYLPLAHILEFGVVNLTLCNEMMVGFGNPRTLTDTFALPHGDLTEYSPNYIVGVPRIFDTIKKAIEAKLPPPGSFKRRVFDQAYKSRAAHLEEAFETPYWNEKAFGKPRKMLGGKMVGMLSGGGPLSASTQEFINVVLGGPLILQGWGLTETVCVGCTQRIGDLDPHVVGQPIIGAEIKLVDCEGYSHTDKPEPRGELCIRGPFLFKGYYKQPELTKEVMDEDGWFHTGDVGAITSDGRVKVVGRIKALAKNCLGEYIALETLESVYSQNELSIVNGVCVVVHPDRPFICALVLTSEERAVAFATANKISIPYPEVLKDPAFLKLAAASVSGTAKAAGRAGFEQVKVVRVLADDWTPENGLLTPTSKLRRRNIEAHYEAMIAEMFNE